RGMARDWKKEPPYRNWSDYRDSLREYADDVIRKRDKVQEIYVRGMASFYKEHAEELRKNPTNRELNGAMAIVMLAKFEAAPERWEAIRWLNDTPPPKDEPFPAYLKRWHDAAPEKHRAFIADVITLYGQE